MTKLSEMTVNDAAEKAIELITYGNFVKAQGPSKYGTPFTGTFEEFVDVEFERRYYSDDDEPVDFGSARVWERLKYEGKEGTRDGWTGKLVAEYGGEGGGDQFWMVVSVSDGETTRYFRRDGWYSSYADGGNLDGDIREVNPAEKVVTVYE